MPTTPPNSPRCAPSTPSAACAIPPASAPGSPRPPAASACGSCRAASASSRPPTRCGPRCSPPTSTRTRSRAPRSAGPPCAPRSARSRPSSARCCGSCTPSASPATTRSAPSSACRSAASARRAAARSRACGKKSTSRSRPLRVGAMSTDEPADGVALCLSGGGYRAMLFHVGVVWRLHDAGWLKRLDRVSSVSGGSITAGALALAWPKLEAEGLEPTFVAPIRALAGRTVDATSVIAGALTPDTISERVAKAYRRHLFGEATLQDLPDHPRFVINATSVQSGVLFRFSKPFMADWRVGRVNQPTVALADAVAASSAFPPVLSPFELDLRDCTWVDEEGKDLGHGEYRERAVLSDGGVYDNLGLETAWKACKTVLVSDAGGRMAEEPDPDHDWGRHLFRVLGVIDNQVRSLRKRQCVEAFKAHERQGAYWGIRSDIADFHLADALAAPHDATMELATLSTRLARLDDVVQARLINWGYAACDAGMRAHVDHALPAPTGYPYAVGAWGAPAALPAAPALRLERAVLLRQPGAVDRQPRPRA